MDPTPYRSARPEPPQRRTFAGLMAPLTALAPACLVAAALAPRAQAACQDTPAARPAAKDARDDVAALRLLAQVDGADAVLPKVREAIRSLEAEARRLPSQERSEVGGALAAYCVLELELLDGLGRRAEAHERLAASQQYAVTAGGTPTLQHARDTIALSAIAQRLKADADEQSTSTTARRSDADDEIRRLVATAIAEPDRQHRELLIRLGATATGALVELALSATSPAEQLVWEHGPLFYLGRIDPARAVEVAMELARRPGAGWRAAVAQQLCTGVFDTTHSPLIGHLSDAPGLHELAAALGVGDELNAMSEAFLLDVLVRDGVEGPLLERYLNGRAGELVSEWPAGEASLRRLVLRLLDSPAPLDRRRAANAKLARASEGTPAFVDLDIARRLLGDEDPSVRVNGVGLLARQSLWADRIPDEIVELWRSVLSDQSGAVVTKARRELLLVAAQEYGASPFDAKELAAWARSLPSLRENPVSPSPGDVARASHWLAKSPGTAAEQADAILAFLELPWPEVRQRVVSVLQQTPADPAVMLALLQAYRGPEVTPPTVAEALASIASSVTHRANQRLGVPGASALYAALIRGGEPQRRWAVQTVEGSQSARSIEVDLSDLAPPDAVATLVTMVVHDPRRVHDALRHTDWAPMADELRAALASSAPTAKAGIALRAARLSAAPEDTSVRDSLAGALTALPVGGEEDLSVLRQGVNWSSSAVLGNAVASVGLLAALLESPQLPNEAFSTYWLPEQVGEPSTSEALQRVMDALERRAEAAPASAGPAFQTFQRRIAPLMAKDPSLYRRGLARTWLTPDAPFALVAQAAHAAGDEALVEEARRLAAAEVAGLQQASEWKIKGLVTGLLAIPGDASAQRLAEIAATTTFEPLREYAVQRLETLALSRELVARLGRVETTELAEARAVQETVALLSSQVEAVRLQAIRGLAILGATTEVPRLVRLVGEGTELEKKAALEALDLLYRRAAREEDAK